MPTEILIALQFILVLVIAVVMLLLIMLRQKRTIGQLKQILTAVKDDISGENLTGYLQLELDNTTAHCKQDTVALKPDLAPEDMGISLRYIALQAELALIQDHVGAENTPWREQIKNYVSLGEKITEIIKNRVDHATKTLNQSHNDELAAKDTTIEDLEQKKQLHEKQLSDLKPIQDFIAALVETDRSREELEQNLHKALLGICENVDNGENFRELIYLIHEAFNEAQHHSGSTQPSQPEKIQEESTLPKDEALHHNIEILNNIISHQKNLIRKLKDQIEGIGGGDLPEELTNVIDELEQGIQQTSDQIESIEKPATDSEFPPLSASNEVNEAIEQFIEESAVMVEKIHMLSNQNKLLEKEKKTLQTSIEESSDSASSDSLKLLLETKDSELIELQKSFAELEERYLRLYKDQPHDEAKL